MPRTTSPVGALDDTDATQRDIFAYSQRIDTTPCAAPPP